MVDFEIFKGKSKKTGKEFEALKVTVGEWSTLIFPKSKFELDYIRKQLAFYEDSYAKD